MGPDTIFEISNANRTPLPTIYVVSVLSAWNAEIVTYPLDLIKTRLQIQGELNKDKGIPKKGFLGTVFGVVTEEGPFKLWTGMHATFLRHIIYSGTRISVYKYLKETVFEQDPLVQFPLWKSALCSVTAGCTGQWLATPPDLVKTQIQMEGRRKLMGLPPRVHGIWDAFKKVYASGGVKGLYKGAVPNTMRTGFVSLGDLTGYDISKRFLLAHTTLPDSTTVHILSSLFAGLTGAIVGTPADVIKTRVMNQPVDEHGRGVFYKGTWDCAKQSIGGEGLLAMYKGFIPMWMRLGPWALVFWVSYENIMKLIGGKSF